MRISNHTTISCLALCLLAGITAESVRADGWMMIQAPVYQTYYAATPVTFYHSCHPVYAQPTYSAPSGHAQQTYAPQTYAPQTSQYPDARARPQRPPPPNHNCHDQRLRQLLRAEVNQRAARNDRSFCESRQTRTHSDRRR